MLIEISLVIIIVILISFLRLLSSYCGEMEREWRSTYLDMKRERDDNDCRAKQLNYRLGEIKKDKATLSSSIENLQNENESLKD